MARRSDTRLTFLVRFCFSILLGQAAWRKKDELRKKEQEDREAAEEKPCVGMCYTRWLLGLGVLLLYHSRKLKAQKELKEKEANKGKLMDIGSRAGSSNSME